MDIVDEIDLSALDDSKSQHSQQQHQLVQQLDTTNHHILPLQIARGVSTVARVSHASLSVLDHLALLWFSCASSISRIFSGIVSRISPVQVQHSNQLLDWLHYFTCNSIRAADDFLLLLDSIFGHTDTSRALSAFLHLASYEVTQKTPVKDLMGSSDIDTPPYSSLTLTTLSKEVYTRRQQQESNGHSIFSVGLLRIAVSFKSYLKWCQQDAVKILQESQLDDMFCVDTAAVKDEPKLNPAEELEILLNCAGDALSDNGHDDAQTVKEQSRSQSRRSVNEWKALLDDCYSQNGSIQRSQTWVNEDSTPYEIHWDKDSLHSMTGSYHTLPIRRKLTKRPSIPNFVADQDSKVEQVDWSEEQEQQDEQDFAPYHTSTEDLLENLAHFSKYATAAYGRRFMRLMGIASYPHHSAYAKSFGINDPIVEDASGRKHHCKEATFSLHCGIQLEEVCTSSFHENMEYKATMDQKQQENDIPKNCLPEYFISLNHATKSVVVTIRGTLTLNDLLTNLGCEYQRVKIGQHCEGFVHGGMWRRAKVLADPDGPMHRVVTQALIKYSQYGVILVGHSLGAGVAVLVALQWSNLGNSTASPSQSPCSEAPISAVQFQTSIESHLPPNRPLHAYCYGPPCVMSIELSRTVRGLVTSVIHGDDFVSNGASLGAMLELRDLLVCHAVATRDPDTVDGDVGHQSPLSKDSAFESALNTNQETTNEQSYFQMAFNSIKSTFSATNTSESEEDIRSAQIFRQVKSKLNHLKLFPAGECYRLWTENVQQVEHFRNPQRIKLARVDCPEKLFSFTKFSESMLLDHGPGRYEAALQSLLSKVQQ